MKRGDVIKRITKAAKRASLSFEVSREAANHTVYSLDGLMIPIPRHAEIDNQMATNLQRVRAEAGKKVVEMTTYHAQVERGDRFWLVYVPEIDRWTQARSLAEVETMARELVAVMR